MNNKINVRETKRNKFGNLVLVCNPRVVIGNGMVIGYQMSNGEIGDVLSMSMNDVEWCLNNHIKIK